MTYNIAIGWQKYETEFSGHKISMEIRPLKNSAMIALTPFLGKADDIKDGKMNKVQVIVELYEVQKIAKDIFPDHLQNIEGITVNDQPLTVEILTEESMFSSLSLDIITQMNAITQLTEIDSKNSEGLSSKEVSAENTTHLLQDSQQATG